MFKKFPFVLVGLIVGSLLVVSFSMMTFRNSKDCSQLVIDTYEMASGIDIPKLLDADCHYLEEERIRVGIYVIDTEAVNLQQYIESNELSPFSQEETPEMWSSGFLEDLQELLPRQESTLFHAHGNNHRSRWQCVLEKETGRLWFEIQWLN
ncbi:MAG: hypothetical protein DWQ02_16725 [Bacteroidetes bacterium]|nr:MAG: hypothetical protein DWQ02_16725 [Bacteroidota bacterium]